jgi:hypothetical protein
LNIYHDMKKLDEEELEKFIRDNKERFDIYEPESDHNQHFLNKLINKFKEVINIVPYLVKVGLTTIIIFILSFLIWRTWICPPLTRVSLKYWKAEHDYRYQIHRNTKLTYNYLNNLEEKTDFKFELQKFDESYKDLKKQLREDPSMDNIANMLRFYQEELLKLEENIQNYTNKNSKSN